MTTRSWLLAGCLSTSLAVPAAQIIPQRDGSALPRTGSARISGVVMTTDDTPVPVRRAVVSLMPLHAGGPTHGYHTITDDEGRFAFAALLEGRYDISAARPSFVTIPFGSTKPRRTASPLVIERGENLETVRLLLARGAVVAGTVRDDTGEPVAGLDVRVELRAGSGSAIATAKTDDQGAYRVFGLSAGDYVVSARPRSVSRAELTVPTDAQVDAALRELQARRGRGGGPDPRTTVTNIASGTAPGSVERADFVPIFHPGAFVRTEAAPVVIGAGEERADVDITIRMMNTAAVSGQILDTGGRSPTDVEVWLAKAGSTGVAASDRSIMRADGTFRLSRVMPGRYLVAARAISPEMYKASLASTSVGPTLSASCASAGEEIVVSGTDVTGIALRLRPCLRLAGRVVFPQNATLKPPPVSAARVTLEREGTSAVPTFVPPRAPAAVSADGRFTLGEFGDLLPGVFRLKLDMPGLEPGRDWWLESATAAGRDILDAPFEVTSASPTVTEVVFTFTDKHTSLSGALETASRRQPYEYTVIAFPTNRDWWRAPFRRVRTARPDVKGQYAMQDLPPGEYYLAALTDLAPDDLRDPDFLGSITSSGIRVTIGPGEQKTQNIRLATPALIK